MNDCHANHNPWKAEHMPQARSLDVGVDSVAAMFGGKSEDYRPISYDELKAYMTTKKGNLSVDHHEESQEKSE